LEYKDVEFKIIHDLSVSYELSLLIGNSTDVKENCENFLHVLMSRKNLSFAGYWIYHVNNEDSLELACAIPSNNELYEQPFISKSLLEYIKNNDSVIIDYNNEFYEELSSNAFLNKGQFIIYHVKGAGVLVIHRKITPFTDYEKKQLVKVIDKFGNYIKSLVMQTHYQNQESILRKKMIKELSNTHHQFKFLFDNNFDAVYTYDERENKIIDFNESFKKIFCWNKTIRNFKRQNIIPEYQIDGVSSLEHLVSYKEILKTENKCRFNFLHKRFNNDIFESETTIFADKDNEHIYTTIIKDLTDLKKKEAALALSIANLNNKNIILQKYIDSNVELENYALMASHDLQSPLKTAKAFLELLNKSLKEQLSDRQVLFVQNINKSINHMEGLIKSLLNYSLVSSNKTVFTEVKIAEIIENTVLSLNAVINEKKASIEIDNMPEFIKGDASRLQQLFQNLIANALKFTDENTIPLIKISFEDLQDYWKFYVSDNGIGISEENCDRIFSLFNRLHNTKQYKGHGIGLTMCKKIVEQHLGEINIYSEEGAGSTFYFTISKNV